MRIALYTTCFAVVQVATRRQMGKRIGAQAQHQHEHFEDRRLSDSASATEQQKRIVAKLDALREETQRLESIYQRKLAALEALKKSLLHQAFTGEL